MVESFQFGSRPGNSPERDALLLTGSHVQQILLTLCTDVCGQPLCHSPFVTAQRLCQATGFQNNGYTAVGEGKRNAGKLTHVPVKGHSALPPFPQP